MGVILVDGVILRGPTPSTPGAEDVGSHIRSTTGTVMTQRQAVRRDPGIRSGCSSWRGGVRGREDQRHYTTRTEW